MEHKNTPYETGKVSIGKYWVPKFTHEVTDEEVFVQNLMLGERAKPVDKWHVAVWVLAITAVVLIVFGR